MNSSKHQTALRILVVEDEKVISQLLARTFRVPRFEVIQAPSAAVARQHLAPPPDLIILDLGLVGESGEDFCHSVHLNPATHAIPILVLTGRDMPDLEHSSVAECAQGIVQKPFDAADLAFHVESFLKKAAFDLRYFKTAHPIL